MPKAKQVAKESEYSVIESPPANQNIGLMAKIDAALQTVMEHPVFSDVTLQDPLSVSAVGRNLGYQAGRSKPSYPHRLSALLERGGLYA